MISFFRTKSGHIIAVGAKTELLQEDINKLKWLFNNAEQLQGRKISGFFIGMRNEMVSPWSTTAVEITQNMNIEGIYRVEEYFEVENEEAEYDRMLQRMYKDLDETIFDTDREPNKILNIDNILEYSQAEGLALNKEEIDYLENLSSRLNRPLTDGEVFGFSQVNSEHCRHKIFNGKFIIDGQEMRSSLFEMIKESSKKNPNRIVSAYKDNCAFIDGPTTNLFHPISGNKPDFYERESVKTVISLKAETHNFPTTVEPFNGAATGSGGEIRDRIGGGRGSFPLAGTAVYMSSYPRFDVEERNWEVTEPREWLYQSPQEILTKASNGASDFGNKFGQPLICGSLVTLEYTEGIKKFGYDKVIMLAGGVGYAKKEHAFKEKAVEGESIVLMGGDNYRIGMGGGAVSSVATGEYNNAIELNAIQRSNPEMQKRVYNTIRSIAEGRKNIIVSIHDHGAGGHLNCFSELVEETGGNIDISKLPIGDPTLSAKEIIGNESQERMGMLVKREDITYLSEVAARERAPMYVVGETSGKHNFSLTNSVTGESAIDLDIKDMLGSTPQTVIEDNTFTFKYDPLEYDTDEIDYYLEQLLQLESVACKDWLTNKVDRSVSGLVAAQQTVGELQLPLSNLGVIGIGHGEKRGIATSIGHAPSTAIINASAGSRMAIAEALTNIIWTPIEGGLSGISLSANWMWPCRNQGEDARLYEAVSAASAFAIELGINIPTGKDSLSMTQKYPNGEKILSPGTVIISAVAESKDITKVIKPVLTHEVESSFLYIPFCIMDRECFNLGGSAFAQVTNQLGNDPEDIRQPYHFKEVFEATQKILDNDLILSGHDISSGGMITALLEMNFANVEGGMEIDLTVFEERDPIKILFSEQSGIIIQALDSNIDKIENILAEHGAKAMKIGKYSIVRSLDIHLENSKIELDINRYRDIWYRTSYLFDIRQSGEELATKRYNNYKYNHLDYIFPINFNGKLSSYDSSNENKKPIAAVIREKGSNGEREMAWALYLAGFSVKDVHMTDLIEGRENLEDVNLITFVGGFSNADTLGSAKGWAGAFIYNKKARQVIDHFYSREDTLSLGVCNGCQLMAELGLINYGEERRSVSLKHNNSRKYESAFVGVEVENSQSIMLSSLTGSRLGIWVAHGEGKFHFGRNISEYNIAMRYAHDNYPANPNGSPEAIAGICSDDGRHLAIMPHPERCIYPHNWGYYSKSHKNDEVSPWIEMFINAKNWILNR